MAKAEMTSQKEVWTVQPKSADFEKQESNAQQNTKVTTNRSSLLSRGYRLLRRIAGRILYAFEYRWALVSGDWDWVLRRKYNRWARWGLGKQLEGHHRGIIENMLAKMRLSSGEQILDLGCGEGMASRLLAERAGERSRVLGVDIADQMIQNARFRSKGYSNLSFERASAGHLPCQANAFDEVLSVECFYYFKNQEAVLKELWRVLKPGGWLFIVICLHKDNPDAFAEIDEVAMPVHNRSAAEYRAMLSRGGWSEVETEIFVPRFRPGGKPNMHERSLAIKARKPLGIEQRHAVPIPQSVTQHPRQDRTSTA